jgi:hypothetical protein
VTIARRRLMIAPVNVSDERRGVLAARGAIWLERERKVAFALPYGESVTGAALGLLDAILS